MPDTCNSVGVGTGVIADASDMWGDDSGTGTESVIMCVNKRYNWIEELTPMTVLPLAKTTSASDAFDMYMDATIVNANTFGVALIEGLTGS